MLLTISNYAKKHKANYKTVTGYIYRGILRPARVIDGVQFIEDTTPFPCVHNGWVKGKSRKKEKTDLDLLG